MTYQTVREIALAYPGVPVREALLQAEPTMFFITDHYLNYPALLVRLPKVDPKKLRKVLEHAWRAVAPKRVVRAFDGAGGSTGGNSTERATMSARIRTSCKS